MNEIRLIAPSAVGILGSAPDGNKKNVLNPTVEIPELMILTVCESPSVPPEHVIVVMPETVSLYPVLNLRVM